MAWLPTDFTHPTWVPVGDGYHLRPIKAADADLDYPAVMGSQRRLWSIFGQAWGWPPASMTYEQDVEDLARHEAEIAGHQSFNYALFDDAETARSAAQAMAVNQASRRVMEKAGLMLVRTFHQPWPYPIEGDDFGDVEYAVDRSGWQQLGRPGAE